MIGIPRSTPAYVPSDPGVTWITDGAAHRITVAFCHLLCDLTCRTIIIHDAKRRMESDNQTGFILIDQLHHQPGLGL